MRGGEDDADLLDLRDECLVRGGADPSSGIGSCPCFASISMSRTLLEEEEVSLGA